MFRLPSFVIRISSLVLTLFALANSVSAQSVRWEPGAGTLARDQVSQLSLVFQDAEPKSPPALPSVDGLEFVGQPGRSEQSSFNLSLGSRAVRQRTVTYVYNVRPTRPDGQVRIPAFTIETDAGALSVPAAGYTLATATVGQSGLSLDQIATAAFTPPAAPIWAGEVFRLGFTLDVDRRYATNSILAGPIDWKAAPLIAEEWSKPSGSETQVNGQARLRVSSETRAVAPTSTTATLLSIPAATQLINLPTGQASPFSLFGQTTFEQFTLTTSPARLAINPLPSPAPADFIGAVGQFTLASKVIPETATVGEPITWTLTLEGTGNWPAIDRLRPRSLSRDFRVITPRAQKTPKPDSLFDASLAEDLVLIPQKTGRITLPAYTVSVFNPSTGAYETLRTGPVVLEITPAPTAVAAPVPSPSTGTTPPPADLDTHADTTAPAPAQPPAPLPADPQPATPLASAPLDDWPSALRWTLLALLLPVAVWLGLASRHARLHDPLLPRRHAHDRLRQILTELETAPAPSASTAELLLAWQHHTATLFDLGSATPSARDFADPLWAALWTETERALYRADTPLAREWFAQAWQAHAQATPPARSPLAALRPAHLLASASLWALVLPSFFVIAHSSFAASTPDFAAAYAAGSFPAAETAARDALASSPLSPGLHHNLALALAQQGKWDEAHAHATIAALQSGTTGTTAPATARLLSVTTPKSAYRAPLPPPFARALTVRQWQHLALAAALALLVLPATAYLLARYSPPQTFIRSRSFFVLRISSFGFFTTALAASLLALHVHRAAIHPAAVIAWRTASLRAVPTDVGDQKVIAELPAGTVARIDKTFLGWRRLVLPDGNTGWVRVESLAGLWQTP